MHALVPEIGLDRRHIVPVVARGVVHQHGDRAEPAADLGDGGAQGGDIAQVAGDEHRVGAAGGGLPARPVEVEEGDTGALGGEMLHHARTDPAGAAGDEDNAAAEAGVTGEGFGGAHAGRSVICEV